MHTGVIIPATARYWQPIFSKFLAILDQYWAVSNFTLKHSSANYRSSWYGTILVQSRQPTVNYFLLGQCCPLHGSSVGPTMAAFVDCLNLTTFSQNLAQYRPYTKPIVTFTTTSSSILEVRKPDFGTASARRCVENKCWQPEIGPELAAKCIPDFSFQQRHDIGNRSSGTFLPMLGQSWTVSHFTLGHESLSTIKDVWSQRVKKPFWFKETSTFFLSFFQISFLLIYFLKSRFLLKLKAHMACEHINCDRIDSHVSFE